MATEFEALEHLKKIKEANARCFRLQQELDTAKANLKQATTERDILVATCGDTYDNVQMTLLEPH